METQASIIQTVESFGGKLVGESHSTLSISTYLKFEDIQTAMPKSKRREFFRRFPKANGATYDGRFSVRISDHGEVSCRESSMFSFRLDRDVETQLTELREILRFLQS